MKNGGSFHSYVAVYQRVAPKSIELSSVIILIDNNDG